MAREMWKTHPSTEKETEKGFQIKLLSGLMPRLEGVSHEIVKVTRGRLDVKFIRN